MNKKNVIILIIMAIFIGLLTVVSTYSFWTWNSNTNKNIVFNTAGDLKNYVVYEEGESKFVGDLGINSSIHSTIAINKNSNDVNLLATIHMDINSIGDNMKASPALKWKVTNGDDTSFNDTPIAEGNFIDSNNGDTITLVPIINVLYKGTNDSATKYTVWIYLDGSESISPDLTGETLDTNVWTEINQSEGMEDVFEISKINVNYQIITATAVDSLYDITGYKVTTTNTQPSSWDSASGKIFNLNYIADSATTYYIWVKDSNNRVKSTSVTVESIDTTGPSCVFDNAFSKTSIKNEETATIKLTCTNSRFGIKNSNITLANLSLSSANMLLTSIDKASIENGYEYLITVTGTSTDDTVTITLASNVILDQANNGNSSTVSPSMAVVNKITCAAGYYLKANEYSCTICPTGSQCPGGTYNFFVNSDQGKTLCSPGYYANSTGRSSCSQCSPGYYASGSGTVNCSSCSAGTYASGNGNISCSNCSAGTYSSSSASSCTDCAKGTYQADTGSSSCTVCPAGNTTSSTGSTSSSACIACANTGAANVSTWMSPPPTWSSTDTVTNICTITSCNSGYVLSGTGSSTSCQVCPAGTYLKDGSCVNCPIGSYSNAGASSCTLCPGGTTNNVVGSSSCPVSCENSLEVATWVTPTFTLKKQTKYSHTSNIDDTGKQTTTYGNNWTNANITGTDRGDTSKAHVVTIPGASQLTVELYFNGESKTYDWVSVWAGSYPSYTAGNDYSSTGAVTQTMGAPNTTNKYGGKSGNVSGVTYTTYTVNGNTLTNMGHVTLTIPGNTVTFGFKSDSSGYGGEGYGYGYYAIIEGDIDAVENTCSINSCNTGFTLENNVCIGQSTASTPTVTPKYVSDNSSYTSGTWANQAVYVTLSSIASDTSITDFQYSINGGTSWTNMSCSITQSGTTYSCNYTWPLVNNTNDTILFRGIDTLGRLTANSSSLNIKYDTEGPTGSIPRSLNSGTITATLDASDSASGVGNYYYKLLTTDTCGTGTDGTTNFHTPSNMSNYTFSLNYTTDGTYYICTKVYDNANNISYISRRLNTLLYTDPSGANQPVLTDGLLPVMISNNGATVTVASDSTDEWYDYGNSMWANAVLVDSSIRDASPGDELDTSKILAYYVWIPRYSYVIQTVGVSSAGNEQAFNITFIDTETKHTGSTVGALFTPTAFTFDLDSDNVANDADDELAGIWVGKFELSHTSLTTSSMSCTSTTCTNADNLRILPNVNPLRSNSISSFFYGIRSMQRTTTTFGLSTDSTVVDSHMMKNSEWGAVAYLAHSIYGKGANEVRINNYISQYITGCGASDPSTVNFTCYDPYGKTTTSDPSTTGDTTTYPQSTTGNITGVFDMSGGLEELVMGNYNNRDGGDFKSSWFTTTGNSKYYNKYTVTDISSCTFAECGGHALNETYSWYGDSVDSFNDANPWLTRGGSLMDRAEAGAFNFSNDGGDGLQTTTSRAALVVR